MKKLLYKIIIILLAVICSCVAFAAARPSAKDFPDKTLIIGNYAIELEGLTDEIYELAIKTADENNQPKLYFKSDINSGTWYDITNSNDITQISVTTDNIVANGVVDRVELLYYVKKDGKIIELSSGKVITVSDITDLSNPNNMPEMEEVKNEYSIQNSRGDDDKAKSISGVLKLITDDELEKVKKQLSTLDKAILLLNTQDEKAVADEKHKELSNRRDTICYNAVYSRMDSQSRILKYDDHKDLIDKYSTAMTAVREKLAEIETGLSTDSLSTSLYAALAIGDSNKAADILRQMKLEDDIAKGNTNVSYAELNKQAEILQNQKKEAESNVNSLVKSVMNDKEYKEALKDGSSKAVINKLKEDMAEKILDELKNVIEIDSNLAERQTDPNKQLENLENTQWLLEKTAAEAPAELKSYLKDGINALLAETKENISNAQLAKMKEYTSLKTMLEEVEKAMYSTHKNYMDMVEKNNIKQAEAAKKKLDELAELKNDINKAIGDMKDAMDDKNNAASGSSALGKTQAQKNKAMNAAKEAAQEVAEAVGEQLEEMEQLETSSDNLSFEPSADSRYQTAEVNYMNSLAEELGEEFVGPWYIRFTDYNVKLSMPLYVSGKELYVPIEELCEQTGVTVIKSNINNAIVLKKAGGILEFIEGDSTIYINDKRTIIKPEPKRLYGNKIYIPLSAYERAFGFYDTQIDSVTVVSKK